MYFLLLLAKIKRIIKYENFLKNPILFKTLLSRGIKIKIKKIGTNS